MRSALLALAASLALAGGAFAQERPDFSGTWRLDAARSDVAAHTDATRPETVTITQTASEIRVHTVTPRGTATTTYLF
jgi:hypothetical protein